ncbi:MAG: BCD family MFS transporter [Caldilineaceae bacterium]|nr:BCD family MFS transporter [Caldilineaceae bacterium]
MNWKTVAQLSLVHVGVSITVVPITSTLNRIMINEMQLSALLVGTLVALPYLLSPLQIFVGNWADRHPLWERHRSPWMLMGGLMAAFGSYLAAHTVILMDENFALGLAASVATFVFWGMGVNIASVSYLSLVSELTENGGSWRSRTVSAMWTSMILSTILVAIALSIVLEPYTVERLYTAFGAVWLVSCLFIFVGSSAVEPPATPERIVHNSADNPVVAMRLLSGNASARRFFVYLLLVLISIHAQDVLLEPYGGEVLEMSVAATSRLTALWGIGVFLTLVGGLPLVRRFGKKASANTGALVTAFAFGLIIAAGVVRQPLFLMASVLVLGLGGGLMTVSNLSFMLDMTIPEAAGLYIGAWGVANFAGQAVGNVISGLMRDVAYRITGNEFAGYAAVFSMEIVAAVVLFRTISVETFRRDAQLQLQDVLALAGD